MKVCKLYSSQDSKGNDLGDLVWFWCPGCNSHHTPRVRAAPGTDPNGKSLWTWNNDEEKPTFSPSILVWGSNPDIRCHSFVRDGQIQFLADCGHSLAGQTVPLPEYHL